MATAPHDPQLERGLHHLGADAAPEPGDGWEEEHQAVLADADLGIRAGALRRRQPEKHVWLVPGLLKQGWSLKMGGREKTAGKGTVAAYLIGAMERVEPTVFGPSGHATALIYTEEPEESLVEKLDAFGVELATVVFAWELAGVASWPEKVKVLTARAVSEGHGVLYVDNLSRAAGVVDESGVELGRAAEVLIEECAVYGLAAIMDVHHKKGTGAIEDKTRGGTALQGAVDVNLEIVRRKSGSRVRTLTAFGRIRATNWERRIELSEDGTTYTEATLLSEMEDALAGVEGGDDLALLRALGPTTAAAFAERAGVGVRTAQRRLKALEEAGVAHAVPGVNAGQGKAPTVYEAEASDNGASYGVSSASRANDGVGNPAPPPKSSSDRQTTRPIGPRVASAADQVWPEGGDGDD